MNIIKLLNDNNILNAISEGLIYIDCPYRDQECAPKHLDMTFMINPDTSRGECGECQITVGKEVWLEKLGISDKEEVSEPRKKYSKGKRNNSEETSKQEPPPPAKRIIKIDKPTREVSFDEWSSTIETNFHGLMFPAEVAASVIVQILITEITNPFALVLVDVPSSGKTITLNFFDQIEGITYSTDKFTPASFVSNASNIKKEDLAGIDLLLRIRYKALLIRDLATIFSKSDDSLNESLGLLTRVLDGQGLSTDSGTHGQRGYLGDYLFMMLAASTPIQPRVWKVMGNIGSRLFFLNMGTKEKSEDELAEQIITRSTKDKERVCREATKDLLHTLWSKNPDGVEWNRERDDHLYIKIIARCAKLLAKLRGVIYVQEKTSGSNEVSYKYHPPTIENPDRITQLLYNLCRGHAVLCGRKQISPDDLRLAVELAIESAPTTRAKLFRALLLNNGLMRTHEVKASLQCSTPTAHTEMETLKILHIANVTAESDGFVGEPEKKLHLSKDFAWFLSEECRAIRGLPTLPPTVSEDTTTEDTGADSLY